MEADRDNKFAVLRITKCVSGILILSTHLVDFTLAIFYLIYGPTGIKFQVGHNSLNFKQEVLALGLISLTSGGS